MTSHQIGLGTYRLGADTERVCLSAFELGYRHMDTATLYGNEAAVGTAVRLSGLDRSEIFVTSKVAVGDIRSGDIADAVGRSIDRIGQIDAMLLHAPVGDADYLDQTWTCLIDACERHGIATAGVSNYREVHLDALPTTPAVNQIEVSPFLPRTNLVAYCRQGGIQTTAHSPLVKAQRFDHQLLTEIASEVATNDEGAPITIAQLLLAWSLAKGHIPIPRSSAQDHLAENLAAKDIALSMDQLVRLDALADGYATHPQHAD